MTDLRHVQFEGIEPERLGPGAARPAPVRSSPGKTTAPRTSSPLLKNLDPFLSWLLERNDLDASCYQAVPLQRRLAACLRQLRVPNTDAARRLLEQRPELLRAALDAVLIGVSEFFRDVRVFEQLESTVLPKLLAERQHLSVLSAGASEGQELYSVAMLLAESDALQQSRLVGSDGRPAAVAKAMAGVYAKDQVRGVNPSRMQRWFAAERGGFEIVPALRKRIHWRLEDLFSLQVGQAWDVILYRNVAIYLTPEHGTRLWEKLIGMLRPGGVLITGTAERAPATPALRCVSSCIYYRV